MNTKLNTKYNRNKKADIKSPSGQVACDCVDFNYGTQKETCNYERMHENKDDYTECVILSGQNCPHYTKGRVINGTKIL